jgi:acetyl/propionyl-CoA carboxylase alpha subunit/acetyl-CoA carboxylase carboxyltransferase component
MSRQTATMHTIEIKKIAILNRGEPAVRFCRGLQDYNFERGTSIQMLALYTTPDAGTPFTMLADEAYHLGPALITDDTGHVLSAYLDIDRVLTALHATGCDALWPGWGFAAEDASFVQKLEDAGITFIGPCSTAMQCLGDKIAAKQLAQRSGVPLAPWWALPAEYTMEELHQEAQRIGFPMMVKASAGGGGRGIRKVETYDALHAAIQVVQDEVQKVFGAGGILLEACVTDARHVEVQLLGDQLGEVVALDVRDCSAQRRNQKVIEEAPSPILPTEIKILLCESSVRLAKMAGYTSAGTAEFLYQPSTKQTCFLEVNSRLQVEHTVTECITGVDLIHGQIDVARGLPLTACGALTTEGLPPASRGWAIEVRLCAEDATRGFAPTPGRVSLFRPPSGPGIRIDSGIVEGSQIAVEFDSMIAKIIATGATRSQAIARLRRALTELQVVIEDGATNKSLLLELLAHPKFIEADLDTGWLDRALMAGEIAQGRRMVEALCFAAIIEYRHQRQLDINTFLMAAQRGVPRDPPHPAPLDIALDIGRQRLTLSVCDFDIDRYLVGPQGAECIVRVAFEGEHSATLWMNDERLEVAYASGNKGITVEIDGALHTVEPASGGTIKAPAPAMVVDVSVQEGQSFQAGDQLLTLEAMKLEMPLMATEDGVVRAVLCNPNQRVSAGQVLILLEADHNADEGQSSTLWTHSTPSALQQFIYAHCELVEGEEKEEAHSLTSKLFMHVDALDEYAAQEFLQELWATIRAIFLGYNISEAFASHVVTLLSGSFDFQPLHHPTRWKPIVDLLRCFAEIQRLFDRTPRVEGASTVSDHALFFETCRLHDQGSEGVPEGLRDTFSRALTWYGAPQSGKLWRTALFCLHVAYTHNQKRHELCAQLLRAVVQLQQAGVSVRETAHLTEYLDSIAQLADPQWLSVADNAAQANYLLFVQSQYVQQRQGLEEQVHTMIDDLQTALQGEYSTKFEEITQRLEALITVPEALSMVLVHQLDAYQMGAVAGLSVLIQRTYGQELVNHDQIVSGVDLNTDLSTVELQQTDINTMDLLDVDFADPQWTFTQMKASKLTGICELQVSITPTQAPSQNALGVLISLHSSETLENKLAQWVETVDSSCFEIIDVFLTGSTYPALQASHLLKSASYLLTAPTSCCERVTWTWLSHTDRLQQRTYIHVNGIVKEDELVRDIHPAFARRFELNRLSEFQLTRIHTEEPVYAYRGVAHDNPRDERIFVYGCVRSIPDAQQLSTNPNALAQLEHVYYEALRVIREAQAGRNQRRRLHWNRLTFYIREPIHLSYNEISALSHHLNLAASGLGLEKVVVRARVAKNGIPPQDTVIVVARPGKHRLQISLHTPSTRPVRTVGDFEMNVVRARRLGCVYPYELVNLLTGGRSGVDDDLPHPDLRSGTFVEYDLNQDGLLVPIEREYGLNRASIVIGTISNPTQKYPQGMQRVLIINDPTRAMCALAEPECRRILVALQLAQQLQVPVEWISISAGAKIAMNSGTENLDWTARVLKGIIEYTQKGGVIHVIVAGVNVGAQSYWNAEATMLMHTKGLLIMTEDGSCVLTGKKALEVSGSIAAEDERGIGGWERVMGPNGQAQLFASDLADAYFLLMEHYRFTWTDSNHHTPARFATQDPHDRDICATSYQPGGRAAEEAGEFVTVGEIFSHHSNPGRKRPFDIRAVMHAVIDHDGGHLERFTGMNEGETAVIWDAHIGGYPICLMGFESRPLKRRGSIPTDGPDIWTGGTLFPQSSKKIARAINATSGNRPVVVLANLSGFDGSPESLRKLQLEYGAEIGRAVVNFEGKIIFVVIGRYHGGAYVVFSKSLNDQLTALALTGSYASVIGGSPAAAVVFPREVRNRSNQDPRVKEAVQALREANSVDRTRLRTQLEQITDQVMLEMQGQVAEEFDRIHTVERAVEVGSLDAVITPQVLRPEIIARLTTHSATHDSKL